MFRFFSMDHDFFLRIGQLGRSIVRVGGVGSNEVVNTGGTTIVSGPTISPAYLGVGYIIGPELAALNFSGGVLAWGLLVPLLHLLPRTEPGHLRARRGRGRPVGAIWPTTSG